MGESYGERVARLREELGITQEVLAERIGIPKRTLQDIENGRVVRPQRRTREKIDAALDIGHGVGTPSIDDEEFGDLPAFLHLLEVYLVALSVEDRTAFIHETIRRMARPA